MKVGLFFGSFNPIHVGHLIIANHVIEHTDLKEIWFVVSPQNPLKSSSSLLNEYQRLHLVQLAIEGDIRFKDSNIEFKLPRPSYTIETLAYLKEKYPTHEFSVIMGGDSYSNIHNWKNHEAILKNYRIIVYSRVGSETQNDNKSHIYLTAPVLNISSTFIRNQIKEGKSVKYLVSDAVYEELRNSNYYK